MKFGLLILFAFVMLSGAGLLYPGENNSSPAGNWGGRLSEVNLRVGFDIADGGTGWQAVMNDPDQGLMGLPASSITIAGPKIHIEIKSLSAVYDGEISGGGIKGKFSQKGLTFELDLVKLDSPWTLERPQEPKKPYPYIEEDVSVSNTRDNVILSGTLTEPENNGRYPAVCLIQGSGPLNRDEEAYGHRIFLVIADYLTRQGFAVLRCDKRGTGKSTGVYSAATSPDFASDACACVEYLKGRKDIISNKIGLIGHSEGGIIAPMAVNREKNVAFIVLLAGPGTGGRKTCLYQNRIILKSAGAPDGFIAKYLEMLDREIALITADSNDTAAKNAAIAEYDESSKNFNPGELDKYGINKDNMEKSIDIFCSPWWRYFLSYDPSDGLKTVKCPVLALNGDLDTQVYWKDNLLTISNTLASSGNTNFKTIVMPGLNHLFQKASTGLGYEYGIISETFNPDALRTIGDWIIKQVQ
ncbi:MAG: alpha/beta fold hydrolase [Brevinematales bacterium]|jgi:pimeloyl-ACP methyl ester carboxylesterase